jgi:hypothetical protein
MRGRSDPEQLAYAAREGRCLMTADKLDFTPIHLQYQRQGVSHAGILVLARQPHPSVYPRLLSGIAHFVEAHPDGFANTLMWFGEEYWNAT